MRHRIALALLAAVLSLWLGAAALVGGIAPAAGLTLPACHGGR